jgi:pimeloyl-ACP methyl ester carboxylesterase
VRAPTLIVHGAEDRFVPVQYVDDFVRLIPNATSEVIPGAGHMLLAEAHEQVLAAMTRVRSRA